ncbi:unnamed protein product [Sphenostylis stenocarpa]|uniref:Pentatricopeptide repeat-containing protein n=1 Tax=Sphenostylis stenocarpa TaxID=92480 RepID=A0AA86W4Y5_9FABA|nr:unnamed protein product [Sphenostylis stenocarpa]
MQVLDVVKNIDIMKLSSAESIAVIFQSLGRLQLESVAKDILLDFRSCEGSSIIFLDKFVPCKVKDFNDEFLRNADQDADNISNFIASYAVSIPNSAVEDIIPKVNAMHELLGVLPSSASYEKLILHCCGLDKRESEIARRNYFLETTRASVRVVLQELGQTDYDPHNNLDEHWVVTALDIVETMCDAGFNLSTQLLQLILQTCEKSHEYNLIDDLRIEFACAYKIIDDLEEMSFKPTTNMYNAIMAGYYREKNISGGLRVLKYMQGANVKPDSQTFSYLINNCETEEDIIKIGWQNQWRWCNVALVTRRWLVDNTCLVEPYKEAARGTMTTFYFEEMNQSGVPPTKQIFMALIDSYADCGKLEKAKQVVLDPKIPNQSLNEIKSVLVSALASHGQLSEALLVYEQIKKCGHNLEPKAAIVLIEVLAQHNEEVDRLLLLLKEVSDLDYWVDGCFKVIKYCTWNNNISSAILLFKQLKDKFENDEMVMEGLFDTVFYEIATSESTHLQIGLDLLRTIKDELGLMPSRQCLDFLLSACVNAGYLNSARMIWGEYEIAGFPYNVLSYLRMYQALLAAGDARSAYHMLKKIPRDDAEVRSIIIACQETYGGVGYVVKKKKRVKRKERKEHDQNTNSSDT